MNKRSRAAWSRSGGSCASPVIDFSCGSDPVIDPVIDSNLGQLDHCWSISNRRSFLKTTREPMVAVVSSVEEIAVAASCRICNSQRRRASCPNHEARRAIPCGSGTNYARKGAEGIDGSPRKTPERRGSPRIQAHACKPMTSGYKA